MSNHFYQEFEEKFKVFANQNEDIRAVAIMGSRARKDHPADEYADLDLFIYSEHSEKYLVKETWLYDFGKVLSSVVSRTASNDPERLTLYKGGFQVDTVIFDLTALT